jgi:arylsulfatase A-like enzyme
VRAQRNSWHGVDYMYHGQMQFDDFYRRYAETLLALDESVGRVLDYLDESGLARGTLVLYMGDNGFLLGEHGLIDKRHAYEESIRVPMLAYAPGWIRPGTVVTTMVRNIDIAPTVLELAGLRSPSPEGRGGQGVRTPERSEGQGVRMSDMDGRSIVAALTGGNQPDPGELLYEYYWEYAFPHTPTTFALRTDRFKYILYHGVWDRNELYDLTADPEERVNLIAEPTYRDTVLAMHDRLWKRLQETDGMRIPLRRGDWQAAERRAP